MHMTDAHGDSTWQASVISPLIVRPIECEGLITSLMQPLSPSNNLVTVSRASDDVVTSREETKS